MINRNRTCIKCSTEFVLKETQKVSNICTKCKGTYQREYARRKVKESPEDQYKDTYPYDANEKMKRFRRIKNELSRMRNREEWQEFFKDKLIDLEQNEPDVLIWIYDRRDEQSRKEIDRIPRKQNSYEDTRSTKNNDKSWFD